MKNIMYKIQGLTLLLTLVGLVFLSSCEKDDEGSGAVVLLSFGPSGVEHGEEITFFGQNMDAVTAIVFQPDVEVPKSAFNSVTSDRIIVTIPEAAEAGIVILKTPSEDIETKTILNFEVPVIITSITEEAKPGTNITITGDKINWIESITFTSDLVVEKADFESQSITQLVVTVPMEAQTGFLIFATGGTEPLTFGSEEQLIVTLPVITSFSPTDIRHTDVLTIAGTDLDLVTSIVFAGNFTTNTFVSKTATEIKVAVPTGTVKGKFTLMQASPVNVVSASDLTILLPVGTGISPKPAVPGVDNITITGTNLDLVGKLTLPSVANPILAATFVSQSATQIVLAVPAEAKSGSIYYETIHGYSNNLGVTLVIPAPGPPPLAITMYDETVAPGGGNWSWSGTATVASGEQFYSGDVSFKFVSTGGGGASIGGMTSIDASGYGTFVFSLYGGPGTAGKQVAAILGDDSGDEWGSYNAVNIVEGQWTEFRIPFTSYPTVNFTAIKRWIFKVESDDPSTIYVDRVGFDPPGPPPLSITMYDETIAPGGGNWGWSGTADVASTEEAYSGDVSWKFQSTGGGGASAGGMNPIDASTKTYFKFALYGGPGTAGKQVAAIMGDDTGDEWGSYNAVSIVEGQWTEYQIPLTSYPTVNLSAVRRWIFKVESDDPSLIYVDRVGFD